MYCEITPGCENYKEGNTKGCASCNAAARKASKVKVKVVAPVKKVSQKRADELKQYPGLKKEYIKHNPICEIKIIGCQRVSTEIHHCSLSAKNFLNTDTWLGTCITCHRDLENMPAEERRERGWLYD